MNKVKFGLKNVHIAMIDEQTSVEGTPAWDTPIAIKGAVNISVSPEGDSTEFYADNTKYYTTTTNNGYTGDLEMADLPASILEKVLGMTIDSNNMLVESADDVAKEFALIFEVDGDERNRRAVFYRCKATRPNVESSTKESSVNPQTDTLNFEALPILNDGKRIVKGTIELDDTGTNQAAYDAFLTQVILPGATIA
ncbi:phage major tail protein, phi13 family [Orenia metallireducens]|uniref:Phage major tail protein, phi13 family n=1 Tax=Orenia metallireducens TaxID=1413210 RepID=A0A285G757_9FIRM|nr:major tail protein [Orenia metallireducens]SNY19422.1 phage major tail protein, phi13 family [Orenia metallireducens]